MADIAATNWNEVDASNTAAAPDGAIEGMMPSGVNNTLRAHQGAIKRFWKRSSVMVTAGAAGAYTVTHTVPPTALADGETELVQFHVANGAGATLNVGALGAKPLHYYSGGAWRLVPAALWGVDRVLRLAYHGSSSAYRILDLPDRTGEIVAFAGGTAPAGSLLCYGQAVSRTAYAGLFAVLGTAHGVGDGTATFNLPDLRGRVAAGKGNMGGSESGRLIEQVASVLGASGGNQHHTLVSAENAPHVHALQGNYLNVSSVGTVISNYTGGASILYQHTETQTSGSGTAHNNVQPTMALNYVIRI